MRIHAGKHNGGFSLLEVLVAVVILSFGLLALAALQGSLFKASADSKAQSVGLALASEKIEYFRGYKDLATYQAVDTVASDPLNPITVGGVSYTRSWTVARYAYPAAGGNFVSVANTGALANTYAANNEFKRIVVTVAWTDAQGQTQRVQLEDAIAGLDPGDSRKIGKLVGGTTPRGPEVRIYDPSTQQEGVIPIAIGGDSTCTSGACAAATNPKPLVNGSNVIETRFDVTTYSGANATLGTATAQSRVETSLVGCTCDYGTAPTSTTARGKRPSYWNGYRYTIPEDTSYVPPAGVASGATGQSELCTICCRDHHDPASLAANEPRFDPRNVGTGGHSAGHFLMDAAGAIGAQRTSGQYTEACRVIRVGGLYRVAPDMYDDYMNTLDTNSLVATPDAGKSAYVPTALAASNYQNFVKSYLAARDVTPSSGLNNRPGGIAALETANSINTQTPVDIHAGEVKWLHLRGLYVDYLEDAALQAISDAKTNCQGTAGAPPTSAQLQVCVLKVLPFTTINLTELGNWTPARVGDAGLAQIVVAGNNCNDANVSTTDDCTFFATLSSRPPVRGKVTPGSSPTDGVRTDATATMRRSNSGLTTLLGGIDTEDRLTSSPSTWVATQPFIYRGTSGNSGGTYLVYLAGYTYNLANLGNQTINTAGTSCTAAPGGNPWSCTSSAIVNPTTLTLNNYNYSTPQPIGGMTLNCSGVAGGTHRFNNGAKTTINQCHNFAVSGSGTYSKVDPSLSMDGKMAESTPVTFPSVAAGVSLYINMTEQPSTYSYTCSLPAGGRANQDSDYQVSAVPCPVLP